MTQFEKLTVGISAGALIVAFAALAVSLYTVVRSDLSMLRIYAGEKYDPVEFQLTENAVYPALLRKRVHLYISNQGGAATSLQGIYVNGFHPLLEDYAFKNVTDYLIFMSENYGPFRSLGGFRGVEALKLTLNELEAKFPIKLDQRDTLHFVLLLDIPINAEDWKLLSNRVRVNTRISYQEFREMIFAVEKHSLQGIEQLDENRVFFRIVVEKEDGTLVRFAFDPIGNWNNRPFVEPLL